MKSQKPLAILVSFGFFWHSGYSRWESSRRSWTGNTDQQWNGWRVAGRYPPVYLLCLSIKLRIWHVRELLANSETGEGRYTPERLPTYPPWYTLSSSPHPFHCWARSWASSRDPKMVGFKPVSKPLGTRREKDLSLFLSLSGPRKERFKPVYEPLGTRRGEI